jgi:hypothetical protein
MENEIISATASILNSTPVYCAGGGAMDLSAAAHAKSEVEDPSPKGLIDHALAWYVNRQTKKPAK